MNRIKDIVDIDTVRTRYKKRKQLRRENNDVGIYQINGKGKTKKKIYTCGER